MRKQAVRGLSLLLLLLLCAAAVCLWYIVMANHAHDHTHFTYRSLTFAVFAAFACLGCLPEPKENLPHDLP